MPEARLDAVLVERGLARSRGAAVELIAAGSVSVDGTLARKPAMRVPPTARLAIAGDNHHVGRGARKLAAALDAFGLSVADLLCLDAGASTGGFTQVLLERGARSVIAVDVGHEQLHPALAGDPRVVSLEGVNVRHLTARSLAELSGIRDRPGVVVADLSFISLHTVLPALAATADDGADMVLLVKPQFEVGRARVRDGVVREARLRSAAVAGVLSAAWALGLGTHDVIRSPVIGGAGNREYLAWISTSGADPTEWEERLMDGE